MTLALTVRGTLIVVNVAAVIVIVAILSYRILSVRREPQEKEPQNLTPFFDDEVMEGRKLERVLRWALVFSVILAVGLPLYWVFEPSRQKDELKGFDDRAIERGKVLFSNKSMPAYDPTKSLLCADCHGTDAGGGGAPFVITPDAQGNTKASPVQVTWAAPALNTVFSRYTEDQINHIITYGRPGTPMPAWGVEGGGPKNDQSVSDLVAYLKSIQLSSTKAREQAAKNIQTLKDTALGSSDGKIPGWVKDAQDKLDKARSDLEKAQSDLEDLPEGADRKSYEQALTIAQQDYEYAQKAIPLAQAAAEEIRNASQGELIFETNCARCHTKGWSYYDPTNARIPELPPQGSGALGPSLRDGATLDQFPGSPGRDKQIDWVANSAEANKPYGVRGISSGKMPFFHIMLTKDQIDQVVDYERKL
jgi:mono/diheme cytochrome c family protein